MVNSVSKALPEPEALNDSVEELHEGDALKRKGRAKRVSKNVKKYLTEIVNESMKHRKKLRANVVMKNLRRATDENGELLFDVAEWPDEEQGNNRKKYKVMTKRGASKAAEGCLTRAVAKLVKTVTKICFFFHHTSSWK